MSQMIPAVIFKNVSFKIHDKIILNKINLEIEGKKIAGILGLNGAGKTTLLSLINGLYKSSWGELTVFGKKMPLSSALKKNIGVVLQDTALYEELTVLENLDFSASLYEVKNPKEKIHAVLKLLDLEKRKNQKIETLSGGLKRRVAIGRSLIHDPELLIIDEPTLGVDAESRHSIWEHLRTLRAKGKTIIIATNYLDEVEALCDSVAILKKGKLISNSTPKKIIEKAGVCLDIQCSEAVSLRILSLFKKTKSINRIDQTLNGLSLFLKHHADSKKLVKTILTKNEVDGITMRTPDLAEIFKSLKN
jgi:ABC-2 type transport system ATP-binding protein